MHFSAHGRVKKAVEVARVGMSVQHSYLRSFAQSNAMPDADTLGKPLGQ